MFPTLSTEKRGYIVKLFIPKLVFAITGFVLSTEALYALISPATFFDPFLFLSAPPDVTRKFLHTAPSPFLSAASPSSASFTPRQRLT